VLAGSYIHYVVVLGGSLLMVFEVPIGIQSTNWYSKYQLVVEVPIGI
jgi:hypothetical protein